MGLEGAGVITEVGGQRKRLIKLEIRFLTPVFHWALIQHTEIIQQKIL